MTLNDSDLAALYTTHLLVMAERLECALAASKFDALVIFSGALQSKPRDDIEYPFRVEPHFAAWLPLTQLPGAALILVPNDRPVLIYPLLEDFWHAQACEPDGYWVEHFDIRISESNVAARDIACHAGKRYAAIGDSIYDDSCFAALNDRLLLDQLDYFRASKTPYEIACLEQASIRAATGHRAVAQAFVEGGSEFELHQIYCTATRQRESELPYPNIVALNEHAAVLHYQSLDLAAPKIPKSFLIDAGAQYAGYAADVTRTWAAEAGLFKELIDSMEVLQQQLCTELHGGIDFVDLNERAHQLLAGVLVQHDMVTCSAEDSYTSGVTRAFLPHGLGHLLGLQVHDAGGQQSTPGGDLRSPPEQHPYLRLTRILQPGFVLTIEPGIYFIVSLLKALAPDLQGVLNWTTIKQLLPYGGIRIEDNLVVQETRSRNLTREAFSGI